MRWPVAPLERIPPASFSPPHCPWPRCEAFSPPPGTAFRSHRHGAFRRAGDGRTIPRFRCLICRRTFSQQTFAFSYYLKRPELSEPIAAGLLAGSAHRQIARSLGCAHTTVTRRAARLGRHALLLSARALFEQSIWGREPIVVDHFETFAFSQDTPFGLATAVGQASWFVYAVDPAPHRRAGRLSPAQTARLRSAPRPSRGGYLRSFHRVLDVLGAATPGPLPLVTDGHPAYTRALGRHPRRERFRHRVFPNPPRGPKGSPRRPRARARDAQMFAVDLLHGLIRHSAAHHRRETIAFGRRLNALVERAFLLVAWRNFVKHRTERRAEPTTPAMTLGLADAPWPWSRVLARRLLPGRVRPPAAWMKVYRREWITPAVGRNSRHTLKNAF